MADMQILVAIYCHLRMLKNMYQWFDEKIVLTVIYISQEFSLF